MGLGRSLRALFRPGAVDAELREELRFHVERETEENVRRGMDPVAARRAALLGFGGVERFAEETRAAHATAHVEDLVRDVRLAARGLARTPLFTLTVVLTLALGIAAVTAVFTVVKGVLLDRLPYEAPGSLVMLWETDRASGTHREAASVPDYFDFLARQRVFTGIAGFGQAQSAWAERGAEPVVVRAALVTANLFPLLGVRPLVGRTFTAEEDRPGGPAVVVLGERLWRRRFDGDPGAVGRVISLDDRPTTIIGVVPASLEFPSPESEIWLPEQVGPTSVVRDTHIITLVARLAPGVTVQRAQAGMAAIAADLEREYPNANTDRGVNVERLTTVLLGDVEPALKVLLAAAALLLVVAAINAANLLLARAAARRHEQAVRAALGATAGRLAQQAFVEGGLLALGAAALGLALARASLAALLAVAPADLPRLAHVALGGVAVGVALAVALAIAALFGAIAWAAGRRRGLVDALAGSPRSLTTGRGQRRFRRLLVVAELATAVVLVISAGLLLRSFAALTAVDPGFEPEHLLRAGVTLPPSRYPQDFAQYPSWPEIQRFHREVVARLAAIPGVRSAALAVADPLDPGFTNSFVIVGREAEARSQPEVLVREVTPDYLRAAGVPLLRGRGIAATDDSTTEFVLLINQAMAHRFFPGTDPIGQHIRFWGRTRRIVGLVGNEKLGGLAAADPPALYAPMAQAPMRTFTILVRTAGDPRSVLPAVQRAVWSIDPLLPLFGIATMNEVVSRSVARQRFLALLIAVFGAVALALAVVGAYGVLSYTVAQRTHEIGVRTALGAPRNAVVGQFVREGMALSGAGIALGIAGAAAVGSVLRTLLFGVDAWDPVTYAAVVVAVALTTLIATWLPSRRAAAVDPLEALRTE
jgi:putative ABC transport system permease protein